jgi:tetratricopeptide (TPR) repeat protein
MVRNGIAREGFIAVVAEPQDVTLRGDLRTAAVGSKTRQTRRQYKDAQGRTHRSTTYYIRKSAASSLNYSLQRGATRVTGDTFHESFDREWSGDSPQAAAAKTAPDEQILGTLVASLANRVVAAVSPHRERRTLRLEKRGHPGLGQGITYMKNGRYDQALSIWTQVAQQAAEPKARAAALYNMGVVKEAQGDFRTAFAYFREADKLLPGTERYIQALTRAEAEKAEQELLEQQRAGDTDPSLTVRASPAGSRIRIMNIAPPYHPGMRLPGGRYDVLVEHPGFAPHREWVTLERGAVVLDVKLDRP